MGRLSIEDKVRQALQGHKQPIDNQELFDSLGIGADDRRRPVFWWFFGIVMALFLVGGLWNYYRDFDSTADHDLAELPSTKPSSELPAQPRQEIELSHHQSAALSDDIAASSMSSFVEEKVTVSTSIRQGAHINDRTPVAIELADNSLRTSSSIGASEARQLKATTNMTETGNSSSDMPVQLADHEKGARLFDYAVTTRKAVLSISEIDRLSHQLQSDITRPAIHHDLALIEPLQAPSKNFFLSTYAEYGKPYRQLTAAGRLGEDLVDVRNEEESVIDYFASGILVHRPLSRSWSLHAGIDYLSINEQFSELASDSSDVPATQITQLTDYAGQVTTSESPGIGVQVIDRVWTYNNQYTRLSIPIGVDYHLDRGAWSCAVRVSALLGLTTTRRGHEYLTDRSVVTIDQKSDIGLTTSFLLGADLRYQVAPQWQIGIGPAFRWGMRDRSVQSVEADYESIGGRISVYRSW